MNSVLGSVLKLINNNIDAPEAPWMKRIAGKRNNFSKKNCLSIFLLLLSIYTSNYS
jgi:hypothetical protein